MNIKGQKRRVRLGFKRSRYVRSTRKFVRRPQGRGRSKHRV